VWIRKIRLSKGKILKKACYLLADSVNRANKSGKNSVGALCGPGPPGRLTYKSNQIIITHEKEIHITLRVF
jgi:hypothetical protein